MRQNIKDYEVKVLKVLSNNIDDFYLVGGTALSLYYFHHRDSFDLDFFTPDFSKARVFEVIKFLSVALKKRIRLIGEEARKNRVKMMVYSVAMSKAQTLKIDFVQDCLGCIKPPRLINGIKVVSLEDIYIRKIYAITGTSPLENSIGRKIMKGGRQEAKDFYDLYCLSHIFMQLSNFSFEFCNQLIREALIRWFRTYSRLDMKTGLLELDLKKGVDYSDMERHFKKEVDKILEKEVETV